MILLLLVGSLITVGALLLGVRDLSSVAASRRAVVEAVLGDELFGRPPVVERWDRSFRKTRIGRRLERELRLAGVDRRPIVVFGAGVGVALASATALWTLLAPAIGVLGVTAGFFAVRGWLGRERSRRLETFVSQMPELARVLANATSAGLSIRTALGVAADELVDPARAELARVSDVLRFGGSMESALAELNQRLPSRETEVLASTLLVSSRAGGSLVTALRDIADTLEERKETRREIRTVLAQAMATGYMVIGLGFAILLLLNVMYPGTVEEMTGNPIGQLALVIAFVLFGGGFLVIRRMTRIET